MKREWRRGFIWLSIVGLCGTLVCETALRAIGFGNPPLAEPDSEMEYMMRPGLYHRFGNTIAINADRMRAPEIARPKPTGTDRILLIGDSVVYGGHRLDQGETIAGQLNRIFADKSHADQRQTRVLPIAASSWGPANMLAFLERYGVFEAKEAWVVLSGHDLHDRPIYADTGPYDSTKPLCAIHDVSRSIHRRFLKKHRVSPQARQTTEPKIDALFGLLRDQGLSVRFYYHRTREEISGPLIEAHEFERMAAIARKHGAPVGQTISAESSTDPENYYADVIHPTPEGAAAIARSLSGDQK